MDYSYQPTSSPAVATSRNTAQRVRDWLAWTPLIALPLAVLLWAPAWWPSWLLMWALAATVLAGCKWLIWIETPVADVPWWQRAGYLLAWPGLDASAFLTPRGRAHPQRPTTIEWAGAISKLLLGAVIFWGAHYFTPTSDEILLGWFGLVGLALMLHFGLFHVLSCAWRAIGVDARPLMNNPLAAASVSEFWARRWNTAYHDLAHRFVFRPLTGAIGPRRAIVAGFTVSGLIHDLVISVPARGGYGWPTLYFFLQAAAILAERSRGGRLVLRQHPWASRLLVVLVVVLPVFALFHPPFVRDVIAPFMRAVAAA